MGLSFQAFFIAAFAVMKRWKLVLFFFLLNFLFSAFLALPVFKELSQSFGHFSGLPGFLGLFDPQVLADFTVNNQTSLNLFFLTTGTGGAFYFLITHLLTGGMISILADPREKTSLKTFFKAAGNFAFRFLRLLFYFALIIVGMAFLNGALDQSLVWYFTDYLGYEATSPTLGWTLLGKNIFMLLVLAFVLISLNYGKVAVIVEDRHFMAGGVLRGFGFVVAHPLITGIFFVLSLALLGLVTYGYFILSRLIDPNSTYHILDSLGGITVSGALLYLLLAQGIQFLIQAALVFRHAGQVYIFKNLTVMHAHPDPELASPSFHTPFIPDRPYIGPGGDKVGPYMEEQGNV